MTVKRMDNVGIVVADLDAAIEFFRELGLELEGLRSHRRRVGRWRHWITDMRVEIAMMRTPDGHGRLELSRFLALTRGFRSPRRSCECARLPTRHVCRGGHRRYARSTQQTLRERRRESRPVQRRVSALLHSRPRRNPHWACPRAREVGFTMRDVGRVYCEQKPIECVGCSNDDGFPLRGEPILLGWPSCGRCPFENRLS